MQIQGQHAIIGSYLVLCWAETLTDQSHWRGNFQQILLQSNLILISFQSQVINP